VASFYPGPCTYSADYTKVKKRVLTAKVAPSTGKKDWRPVKTKLPDCASYEHDKAKDYVGKSKFVHKFAHPKENGAVYNKETFTTLATKRKKYVPGVGSYDPKMDYVAIPYGRKRL
jgi:hypothetical protein